MPVGEKIENAVTDVLLWLFGIAICLVVCFFYYYGGSSLFHYVKNKETQLYTSKELSDALQAEVDLVRKDVGGHSYYILDSSGQDMSHLLTLVPSTVNNYYFEQRDGLMTDEVTNAIIEQLSKVDYVILNSDDFLKACFGYGDHNRRKLVVYVQQHFYMFDDYQAPNNLSTFHDFSLWRRK